MKLLLPQPSTPMEVQAKDGVHLTFEKGKPGRELTVSAEITAATFDPTGHGQPGLGVCTLRVEFLAIGEEDHEG